MNKVDVPKGVFERDFFFSEKYWFFPSFSWYGMIRK